MHRLLAGLLLACLLAAPLLLQDNQNPDHRAAHAAPPPEGKAAAPAPPLRALNRWPGEFERQGALLLGCHQLLRDAPQTYIDVVKATHEGIEILALVGGVDDYRLAHQLLAEHKLSSQGIHFLELPHDTMWTRDYGPFVVEQRDGQPAIFDSDYSSRGRPLDDSVPLALARHLQLPLVPVPYCLDGGNLLSNGQGLGIASYAILDFAANGPVDEPAMRQALRQMFGWEEVVLLEPLIGEPTGHVDMFASFVSPKVVVVAECDPALDRENAELLDRNAARLAEVRTPRGFLRVVRLPMPRQPLRENDPIAGQGAAKPGERTRGWETYTNVVYANGVLLVPSYAGADPELERKVSETYAELLPGWKIVPIDSSRLIKAGGALHCLMMNLAGIGPLPDFPPPERLNELRDEVLAISSVRTVPPRRFPQP